MSRTHVEIKEIKDYKCSICNNTLKNKKSLSNHLRFGGCKARKKADLKCKYCHLSIPVGNPSSKLVFCNIKCYGKWKSIHHVGANAPDYKHGKCKNYLLIRANKIYRDWGLAVFRRDAFTCQICGSSKSGTLEAHHLYSFSKLCTENNIITVEDAKNCSNLWDISNGQTLCRECHKKTDSYGYNKYTK